MPTPLHNLHVTLIGISRWVIHIGTSLIRADHPLVGLYADDHLKALQAALEIGCPAFPSPEEPVKESHLIIIAENTSPSTIARIKKLALPETILATLSPSLQADLWLCPLNDTPEGNPAVFLVAGPHPALNTGREFVKLLGAQPYPIETEFDNLEKLIAQVERSGLKSNSALHNFINTLQTIKENS